MKITKLTAFRKDLKLKKPYTIAYETCTEANNVFLEIELENGVTGIGAAATSEFVFGESLENTLSNLQSEIVQKWVGRDIRHFRSVIAEARSLFPHHPATCAAVDIALHDAFCKYLGIPVVDFYGKKFKSLPTSVTIGISDVKQTLEEALEYKKMRFTVLKVKIGLHIDEDIERCTKLREKFGDYFKIRVDANQGYNRQQTMDFFNATQSLDLELVEQPMPVGSEKKMVTLPLSIRKRIACDESLKDATTALKLASEPKTCGIFNIKLMKCGGILSAMDIATIAQSSNIDLFWGCYDESIVSISAALHAALSCVNTRYLDLDGSLDLAEDLVKGGFILTNGEMTPTEKPGFGFEKC
jgi:L-alanine-DL-glutamate epimerase-like enolase superfamily enzyme